MTLFDIEMRAVLKLCEEFQSVRALSIKLLVKSGEWAQLLELKCDPLHYVERDASKFRDDYLLTSILQKNPRLPIKVDKSSVALDKFLSAEHRCASTNERLLSSLNDPSCTKLISQVQDRVWAILGANHSSMSPSRADLHYAEKHMGFGPGATTSVTGDVRLACKYNNSTIECTSSLVAYRAFCFPHLWAQEVSPDVKIRNTSRYTTVPKNAKTDRSICIEPDLNIFVQKGIGALLRRRLRGHGLDLDRQAETNRYLAEKALDWDLSTIDLSSASDTVSEVVVRLLLPPNWVTLLEIARTPAVTIDDRNIGDITLQKWSAMGNGYTFELETLLFYAVATSVVPKCEWHNVSVFGDDIIVPKAYTQSVIELLEFLGFELNREKTFGTGLFYESCGTDWFNGEAVRPFFFRGKGYDFVQSIYSMANALRDHSFRGDHCDVRYLPAYLSLRNAVSKRDQHPIPKGFGDVGFTESWDRSQSSFGVKVRENRDYQRLEYVFRYRYRKPLKRTCSNGALLASLNNQLGSFTFGEEALRGRLAPPFAAIGYSHEWPNLGEWR